MRDIKFRAWTAKYKQMYWFDIMWGNKHATGSGWIGMLPISETERDYGWNRDNRVDVDPNDCEFMQYTGLKDKNGKEIYEGDILRSWYSRDTTGKDIVYMIFPVEYETLDYKGFSGFQIEFLNNASVIGNIYERPDLLNIEPEVQASVATEDQSSNEADKQNQTS